MTTTIAEAISLNTLTVQLSREVFTGCPVNIGCYDEAKSLAKLECLIRRAFRAYEIVKIQYVYFFDPTETCLDDDNPDYCYHDYSTMKHLLYNEDVWLVPKEADISGELANIVSMPSPATFDVGAIIV